MNTRKSLRSCAGSLVLIFMFLQACSIYKAATAPTGVPVGNVTVGSSRTEVLSVFGEPKVSEAPEGQRTEVFEFIDGHHGASKLRIILYIAGDFFTLGLAELVFWPMELAVLNGAEGRAVVNYGPDSKVQEIKVTKKDGSPWEY